MVQKHVCSHHTCKKNVQKTIGKNAQWGINGLFESTRENSGLVLEMKKRSFFRKEKPIAPGVLNSPPPCLQCRLVVRDEPYSPMIFVGFAVHSCSVNNLILIECLLILSGVSNGRCQGYLPDVGGTGVRVMPQLH